MSRDARARLRNRNIGFVFQSFNLLARTAPWRTLNCRSSTHGGVSPRARNRLADARSSRVGGRLTITPGNSLAASSSVWPLPVHWKSAPILMADEPTGNLDTRTSREIIDVVRRVERAAGDHRYFGDS